ncbi:14550_t:CDS:2 [Ambispora leptoticha]|uniref:Ribosomal RNA-processing protein 42 n=1 Tax=Ambispora leptoticha TaxID=144679 RepID=A0A9N8VUE5_9GLOM|nr:14550_t:CDS:2 [Ambispora leptoticha]
MQTLISHSERDYILHGVESNLRADGRGRLDYRQVTFETGLISQCSGSARCRLGEGTDVLVGVKVEIGQIEVDGAEEVVNDKKAKRGRVVCNVECSPIASQQFAGRGAEDYNNELTQIMELIFNGPQAGIDLEKLCIVPGIWRDVIHYNIVVAHNRYHAEQVLDYAGNILDTIFLTTRAALYNTRVPKTIVQEVEGMMEIEVLDDVQEAERIVGWEQIPIAVTLNKIGSRHIIDATPLEELATEAKLLVSVNKQGKICGMQKSGEGSIEPSLLNEMIQTGRTIGQKIIEAFDVRLREEEVESLKSSSRGGGQINIQKLGFFAAT